jgi:hypothetical protein
MTKQSLKAAPFAFKNEPNQSAARAHAALDGMGNRGESPRRKKER